MMRAFATTLKTDLRLATRNPDMILFGIVFPVAVMLLLGLVSSPEAARLDSGGVAAFGICAAGLMGLPLTLSDYRHRKVLKRIRVTPASPAILLLSQVLVQCCYVLVSTGAVLALAGLAFGVRIASPGPFALFFLLTTASTFGIGLLIASLCPNMKVASAVASLAYFPTIFLSGATVPFEILPRAVRSAMQAVPVTQGIGLLKGAVTGAPQGEALVPVAILTAVAVLSYIIAIRFFRWE
jgi:ABC-2 type transport system permease protein